jgi:hypothetical protein
MAAAATGQIEDFARAGMAPGMADHPRRWRYHGGISFREADMSGIVVVAENGQGRYQQAVTIGQHRLIADEPVSVGGDDAGPAPFDFVMAGLGACTSMTCACTPNARAWR